MRNKGYREKRTAAHKLEVLTCPFSNLLKEVNVFVEK